MVDFWNSNITLGNVSVNLNQVSSTFSNKGNTIRSHDEGFSDVFQDGVLSISTSSSDCSHPNTLGREVNVDEKVLRVLVSQEVSSHLGPELQNMG